MTSLALVLLLLLVLSGNLYGIPDEKFFICPNFREIDREDQSVASQKPTRRNDPLWLLEREDEWIPFRALVEQEQPILSGEERHQPRTFRCIFYYLAAFSHFMLDLFTPSVPVYYIHPYYRLTLPPGEADVFQTGKNPTQSTPSAISTS